MYIYMDKICVFLYTNDSRRPSQVLTFTFLQRKVLVKNYSTAFLNSGSGGNGSVTERGLERNSRYAVPSAVQMIFSRNMRGGFMMIFSVLHEIKSSHCVCGPMFVRVCLV